MTKLEYFNLTPAETYNRVQAYITNRDIMSANFRALFVLQYNQWSKSPQSMQSLWPLSFDEVEDEEIDEHAMYERNKKIKELYYKK